MHRFDSTTGQVVGTLIGDEHRVSDLTYSPDGKQIASINNQGVVRLWEKHQEAFTFRHAAARRGKYSLLFSHDGRQLIVGAFDVEIWDIATVQLVGKFLTNSRVTTLALRSDGIQLAVGTEEGQIEFWSLQTCDRTEMIDGNDVEVEGLRGQVEVNSLAFGPNGRTLVVGFGDAVIAVWDTANQEWMRSWLTKTRPDEEFKGWEETNRYSPVLLTLSRDSRTVVALANRYANVGRWEIDTGKLIGRFEGYGYQQMLGFSADSEHFATFGGVARVWDTVTTEIIAEMQYDNGSYTAALSPNGKYVAITHRDRRITVWDVDTATVKHALRGAAWNRGGITFSPDSRLVAAVTFSFLIRVWDVETGEQIAGLHERDIGSGFSSGSIRFSPDGNWFAAEGSRAIVVWETQGFTLQRIVNGLGKIGHNYGNGIEFSPDSRWIAGYADRPEYKIKFWNIETEEIDLELPTGVVRTAEFSPDGRWFTTSISGPDRDTLAPGVQIWDTQTGKLVTNLPQPYWQVIFSPDGKTVAVGHDDGRIHLLPIETVLPHLPQDITVAVEPSGLQLNPLGVIKRDALLQNYPNPFNPETWIPYQLVAASSVQIHIYNLAGQRVRTLDLGRQPAGTYLSRNRAAYWDGRDALGQHVATGVYFYRLETDDFTGTKRMVIVK